LTYGGRPRPPKAASDDMMGALRGFQRQALHAVKLSLAHPLTGETLSWEAPRPDDMTQLIEALRRDRAAHLHHD